MSKGNEPRIPRGKPTPVPRVPRGKPPGPEYVTRAKIHEGTDKMLDDLLNNPHADVVCFLFEKLVEQFKDAGIARQELSDKFTQTLDKYYTPPLRVLRSEPNLKLVSATMNPNTSQDSEDVGRIALKRIADIAQDMKWPPGETPK